jgi:hypothetical protein
VVGEELVNYLTLVSRQKPGDAAEGVARAGAERCLGMLSEDDDGLIFVDWLGDHTRELFKTEGLQVDRDMLLAAYRWVIAEQGKAAGLPEKVLYQRYSRLRHYLETRLPSWGVRLDKAL